MLGANRKAQDGTAYEVLGHIVSELIKIGTFGSFSEQMMQQVLEGMWNKVEYDLKDSPKMAGQLEECYDFKRNSKCVEWKDFSISFWGRQVSYASSVL